MDPKTTSGENLVKANKPGNEKSGKVSESDMIFYYQHLLPFKHICHWLCHSETTITNSFTNREFAYEYRSGAYQRYNSFSSLSEFKSSVIKANPTRFEIGAVYSVNPNKRKTLPKNALKPLEKELVFDIDLTDYDGIRTCCSGTSICEKCWKFITIGSQIIEKALREDFGFQDLVWVFSGRRGCHCWVSDSKARNLNEQKRRAIIEYLDVLNNPNGVGNSKLNNSNGLSIKRPLHPHINRSFNVLKNKFKDIILLEQNPWENDEAAFKKLLPMISDKNFKAYMKDFWLKNPGRSSMTKWLDLKNNYETNQNKMFKNFSIPQFQTMREDIIIECLYPRLDVEVSRQVIHLLKSPFCIHPSTGNVCVPFDANLMYQDYEDSLKNLSSSSDSTHNGFSPLNVPTLTQLQMEIENNANSITLNEDADVWNETSLKPYVEYFKKFVDSLVLHEKQNADTLENSQRKRKL